MANEMQDKKHLIVKLFFNRSNMMFYVQLGNDMLFMVKDKIATAIQEKEKLNIHHVNSIKEMQINDE